MTTYWVNYQRVLFFATPDSLPEQRFKNRDMEHMEYLDEDHPVLVLPEDDDFHDNYCFLAYYGDWFLVGGKQAEQFVCKMKP